MVIPYVKFEVQAEPTNYRSFNSGRGKSYNIENTLGTISSA